MTRLTDPSSVVTPAPRPWAEMLVPYIPGAGQGFIEQNLLWVLRDFCLMGNAWIVNSPEIEVYPGQQTYVVPTQQPLTTIGTVLAVRDSNNSSYWPIETFGLFRHNGRQMRAFSCPQPGSIEFTMPLDGTTTFVASTTLVPQSCIVPSFFRDQFQQTIETGVQGRMMLMPNRPWTDRTMGTLYWKQYLNGRNIARITAMRAFTPDSQGWSFPRFGV